jgi:RNA polymerase sigma-70 factor (ECF subfamily)
MTPSALDALYREHGHAVLRRARRLLRDEDAARDVLQDVFLEIFHKPEAFEARSSIATYLYAATTHACLNRLRNTKTRARLVALEGAGRRSSEAPSAETRAIATELLAGLSDEEATLALYLFCDELTHDEIAALMGSSRRHIGNLATRLRRRVLERVEKIA